MEAWLLGMTLVLGWGDAWGPPTEQFGITTDTAFCIDELWSGVRFRPVERWGGELGMSDQETYYKRPSRCGSEISGWRE